MEPGNRSALMPVFLMLILPPFVFSAVLTAKWLWVGDGCTALHRGVRWRGVAGLWGWGEVGGCGRLWCGPGSCSRLTQLLVSCRA